MIKKYWQRIENPFNFICFILPTWLIFFVGLFFTYKLFRYYNEDTTSILNVAFVTIASISALSFSFAETLEDINNPEDYKSYKSILAGGERLFHSTILILIASIWKYVLINLKTEYYHLLHEEVCEGIKIALGSIVGIIFVAAIYHAHKGIVSINSALLERHLKHRD